jgi:hypothetical protein
VTGSRSFIKGRFFSSYLVPFSLSNLFRIKDPTFSQLFPQLLSQITTTTNAKSKRSLSTQNPNLSLSMQSPNLSLSTHRGSGREPELAKRHVGVGEQPKQNKKWSLVDAIELKGYGADHEPLCKMRRVVVGTVRLL